jgi:cell filamentation protein
MKYYPPSNHIYYENSDVPINKLDIYDSLVIHEIERELLLRSYEYFHNDLADDTRFDEAYLKSIHRHLFDTLYQWAGEYRTVNISKGSSMFCPYMNLENYSNDIFKQLEKENYLRDYEDVETRQKFAEQLAYYTCELLVLHPFSEGNGRSLRLFFDMIVTYNGYEYIDYADTLNDESFITASIDCMEADCRKMEAIILAGLKKSDNIYNLS